MKEFEPYRTIKEGAEFLKINEFTLYKWALQGKVISHKIGRLRRVKFSELSNIKK